MSDRICTEAGCLNPAAARGWCVSHYGYKYRAGQIPGIRELQATQHRLSQVDRETKTAVCSQCGPVEVRLRTGRRGAECMTLRRKGRGGAAGRQIQADSRRRWKYGLSKPEFDQLVKASCGRCAVCDTDFNGDFHIDHCHQTGRVRGLLCQRCNLALGWFDDSPPRILAAYMYLKSHGKDDSDWAPRAS